MIDDAAIDVMEVLHSCRCCLRRPPDRDLHTPYTHRDQTETYSDMIIECFDIHLPQESDECGICEECVGRLRDACDFKLQVQRSQAELRARLEKARHVIDEELTVKSELADDNVERNGYMLHEELDIKAEMADAEETSEELFYEEPSVKSELSDCGTSDEHSKSLSCPGAAPAPLIPAGSVSARARAQLAMNYSVRLERLRDDTAPHACQSCRDTFHHEASLAAHVRDAHGYSCGTRAEGATYTCDTCGKQFTRKLSLIKHIKKHNMKRKPCSYENCSIKFSNKDNFNKHKIIHTDVKPHTCEVCNKQFTRKQSLTEHKQVHSVDKPYVCEICLKQFKWKRNLDRHIHLHTGRKPYTCEVCSRTFTEQCNLRRHKQIHTGDKPFSCEVCNKKFREKSNLIVHNRIHTGDKPFSCEHCHKRFTGKNDLARHKRTHTGIKPYACDQCKMQFTQKNGLKKHYIRKHAGRYPYSCEVCNKTFRSKSGLRRHRKTNTGDTPSCSGVSNFDAKTP